MDSKVVVEGKVLLADPSTPLLVLENHDHTLLSVHYNEKTGRLFAGIGRRIYVFDAKSKALVTILKGHKKGVKCMSAQNDVLFTGGGYVGF